MSMELETLLTPVSPDSPSGDDLEYDADFARMEKAAQGTGDQEFGTTRIEGTPPDWDEVRDAAVSVLGRSKDLRAATYLAQAELATRGFVGFRDAMRIISGFVDQFWDSVYPILDPEDDNDPTIRINSLAGLCNVGGIVRQLRVTPILINRSVGKFSWTDCAIAKGELPVPEGLEEPPTQKMIDAAVASCDSKELTQLADAVEQSLNFAIAIERGFSDRLGPAMGPNLDPLTKELKGIVRFHKVWLALKKESEGGDDPVVSEGSNPADTGNRAPQERVASGPFVIGKREDAIEGLDKIIRWFERNEPSSPLPMLLRRAKRLSTMSFIDILRDISPDGVTQAVLVGGPDSEKAESPAPAAAPAPSAKSPAPAKKPPVRNDEY